MASESSFQKHLETLQPTTQFICDLRLAKGPTLLKKVTIGCEYLDEKEIFKVINDPHLGSISLQLFRLQRVCNELNEAAECIVALLSLWAFDWNVWLHAESQERDGESAVARLSESCRFAA